MIAINLPIEVIHNILSYDSRFVIRNGRVITINIIPIISKLIIINCLLHFIFVTKQYYFFIYGIGIEKSVPFILFWK
jgi:hypothetical protein